MSMGMLKSVFAWLLFVVLFIQPSFSAEEKNGDTIIDATQNLATDSPCSEDSAYPSISNYEYDTYVLMNDKFYPHMISTSSFASTCIAAPSYMEGNWKTVNGIDIKNLVNVKCYNIDLSDVIDSGFTITVDDIKRFENKYGSIDSNSVVIFFTGWSKYWQNKNQYINKLPTISPETIAYLCDEKNIAGIAIDCPSIDTKRQKFDSQALLFSKGRFLVKNLSQEAKNIPPVGAYLIIAPLKFESCNETLARVFAIVKANEEKSFLKRIFGLLF